jgi:xanthine/uracil/vitamin C permease (AzgA family)
MAYFLVVLWAIAYAADITYHSISFTPKGVEELAEYEIMIVTESNLTPADGMMRYEFPPEIALSTAYTTNYPCEFIDNFKTTATCTRTGNKIEVLDAFQEDLTWLKVVKLKIREVTNPPSDTETSSVKVYTMTSDSGIVDKLETGMTIMADPGAITDVTIR